jgi:hypothetical protein
LGFNFTVVLVVHRHNSKQKTATFDLAILLFCMQCLFCSATTRRDNEFYPEKKSVNQSTKTTTIFVLSAITMGNTPFSIGLKVDTKGPQIAGSIIYGRVYLSVSKPHQKARSIQLKVIGKECLVVHHTSQEDDDLGGGGNNRSTRTVDQYEHATHTILEMDYPLHRFPTGIMPVGQFEYPFALQLPENLPSSMSYHKYVILLDGWNEMLLFLTPFLCPRLSMSVFWLILGFFC